ncbi:MAG: right-handed parallel beta-helix repeat-containing protein [Planctomycetota bacterium]|jgi:hypothetical protein
MKVGQTLVVSVPLWLALSAPAAEYRINSQADFDRQKTATFKPGDRIVFRNGRAFNGMFAPRGSGREGAPIRIAASGTGPRPIINAMGKHPAGLLLEDVEYWEVSGLEITNTDGTDKDQGKLFGIHVLAHGDRKIYRHVYIDGCVVHDVNGKVEGKKRGGIHVHLEGKKPSKFHDLRIVNNTVRRVGGVGIGNDSTQTEHPWDYEGRKRPTAWTGVYVANNFVSNTGRNNIIARDSDGAVYEYNTLAGSSRYSTGHSIFCFNTSHIKIQYNEAYGNVGKGGRDRGGFDADYNCAHTYIQYNYSHDNLWFCGIMKKPTRHVFIRYNISCNDREGIYFYGFESSRSAKDVRIYNNTHFVGKGHDVEVFCEGRTPLNSTFENNIFYFEGKGRWGRRSKGINTKFDNNLYFNIEPHESDKNAITADPLFVSPGGGGTHVDMKKRDSLAGYMLKRNSPCRDKGKVIADNGGLDFGGGKVPVGRPDIGAYEWGAVRRTRVTEGNEHRSGSYDGPPRDLIATAGGATITPREYDIVKRRHVAMVHVYFKGTYGVDDHDGFWDGRFGGENPAEVLERIALGECARIGIQRRISRRLRPAARLPAACGFRQENLRRRLAIESNIPVHGSREFSDDQYLDYCMTNLAIALKREMVDRGMLDGARDPDRAYDEFIAREARLADVAAE